MKGSGSLTLILAPMFSGKTQQILKELTTRADIGMKCIYINSILDSRDEIASSHSSQFRGLSVKIFGIKTDDLTKVDVSNFEVVGIDEAQFFPSLNVVIDWVNSGKIVYIASLIADSNKEKFGNIFDLIPHCDNIIKFSLALFTTSSTIEVSSFPSLADGVGTHTKATVALARAVMPSNGSWTRASGNRDFMALPTQP